MGKYLDPSEYVDHAPSNTGTAHINHINCPAGLDTKQRLYITRCHDGTILAYCHHCAGRGVSGRKLHLRRGGLAESLRTVEDEQGTGRGEEARRPQRGQPVRYPASTCFQVEEFPEEVKHWYQQYGITDKEAKDYGFGYVRSGYYGGRLAIRCRAEGEALALQFRGPPWGGVAVAQPLGTVQGPLVEGRPSPVSKYLSATGTDAHGKKQRIHFKSQGLYDTLSLPDTAITGVHTGRTLVIVEDALSCIKVGRQFDSIAMLTTTLDYGMLMPLLRRGYTRVVVWLDNDNPDVSRKARELYNIASLIFPDVFLVTDKSDPKKYTDTEILETIHGIHNPS